MSISVEAGLRDVIAVNSAICSVDGERGELRYRGYDIVELAEHAAYEETVYLLWRGELPRAGELRAFSQALATHRAPPDPVRDSLPRFPVSAHPLEALRAAIAVHAMYDPDARDNSTEATYRKCLRLTAQLATLVAAWRRVREGLPVVAPGPSRSHAGAFLAMLSGTDPTPLAEEAMNAVLVLHAEHELNASTFAARVTSATVADLHSAVVSALSTLKGPRHGGANEDVLAMLSEIGTPDRAERHIGALLDARARMSRAERADPRHRVPGWGHPVYRVDDPRAARLRRIGRRLARERGAAAVSEVAEAVYTVMKARTTLPVNVDFFSAMIFHALGIPIDLCTSIFATARIAGWCAHVMEQYADNRLIRPRAQYTGPGPRPFIPLDRRGTV